METVRSSTFPEVIRPVRLTAGFKPCPLTPSQGGGPPPPHQHGSLWLGPMEEARLTGEWLGQGRVVLGAWVLRSQVRKAMQGCWS